PFERAHNPKTGARETAAFHAKQQSEITPLSVEGGLCLDQADRLERGGDLRVDGDGGDLAISLLQHMGKRDVELAAVILLRDLQAAQHHPAAVGSGAESLRLEAV